MHLITIYFLLIRVNIELPQDSISPYTSYSVGTFINPDIGNVRRIIIKFCLLNSDLNDFARMIFYGLKYMGNQDDENSSEYKIYR